MKTGLNKISKISIFIVLSLLAMVSIFFIYFMFTNSFKTEAEYFADPITFPKELNLENYKNMFQRFNIGRLFLNSMFYILSALGIEIFICSLAAYAFAKTNFKGKNILFILFISMMIIPFSVLLVPLYIMFSKLNLVNTSISLIIIYSAVAIPFALYFLTANFRRIPNEILEAAKIDGASYFRIYWAIIIQIGKPALITIFILDFVWLWNELIFGLVFLQSENIKTMTVAAATILGGRLNVNTTLLITGLFITSLPPLIMYSIAARFLMKGTTAGSVKG